MHAYLVITSEVPSEEDVKKIVPTARRIIFSRIEKISDVKDLIKDTNISLETKTAHVIPNFDKASAEAQNAFLKRLEEPQENLFFVLTAKNESQVLPTIVSRCEVIQIVGQKNYSKEDFKEAANFVNSSVSERFALTSKISKREDAIKFIENLIYALHQELPNNFEYKNAISEASETLNRLNKNANPTLQMTKLCIAI